jgi:hypothetical protein
MAIVKGMKVEKIKILFFNMLRINDYGLLVVAITS